MKNLKKQICKKKETTSNSLKNLSGFRDLKKNRFSKKSLLIVLVLIIGLFGQAISSKNIDTIIPIEKTATTEKIQLINFSYLRENTRTKLINEVDSYIKKTVPSSNLNPEKLVDLCVKYDMDITFVLAQGIIESHLGTKGKAAQTNCVWNVGTYDDGNIKYRYKDPNESIEPYLKLINEKYLMKISRTGDTTYKNIRALTKDGGYVNYNGERFAASLDYENNLRKIIVEIDLQTHIKLYQGLTNMKNSEVEELFSAKSDSVEVKN